MRKEWNMNRKGTMSMLADALFGDRMYGVLQLSGIGGTGQTGRSG